MQKFAEPGDIEKLQALQQQVEDYIREQAEKQGLEGDGSGKYRLTPEGAAAVPVEGADANLQRNAGVAHRPPPGRRHRRGRGRIARRRSPTSSATPLSQMDIPASMVNALLRAGPGLPVRMKPDDILIHRTRVNPKAATCVLLDMSGSMRYDGQYVNVKRMGLALDGLIRSEYPGDFLQFIEMYTFAKPRHVSEVARADAEAGDDLQPGRAAQAGHEQPERERVAHPAPLHQHPARAANRAALSRNQDTPNRQVVLITDGLPTAHFEGSTLFMLYPPDPRTEEATMREAMLCAREGITINIFLLSNWNQSHEDVQFAYKMAEATKGRVVFTAGRDLDRYVIWDYIKRRKQIIS